MPRSWLKYRKYTHFSPKLTYKNRGFIIGYVRDPESVKTHKFFPFIHYTIVESKKKWVKNKKGKPILTDRRPEEIKKREIFYANHLDSQIFSYYAHLLNKRLEAIYEAGPVLSSAVIGYRSIRISKRNNRCKSNIHFTKEVIDFIKNYEGSTLNIVSVDIKDFFNSLDHKILKRKWASLFGNHSLSPDHYAVYKAITKFNYVEISDILKEFSELKIKRLSHLREKEILSFCKNGHEFKKRVVGNGLIKKDPFDEKSDKRSKGIPQGSPISSVLSNLYLLEFDRIFSNLLTELGGIYRRYSDDIVFICPPENTEEIEGLMKALLGHKNYQLPIKEEKVQQLDLQKKGANSAGAIWEIRDQNNKIAAFKYLGFQFDGNKVLLRNKSISKYYRKTKSLIRRSAYYAKAAKKYNKKNPEKKPKDPWIYRSNIYRKKTHFGSRTFRTNGKIKRGNYIGYAYKASKIMGGSHIKHQVSRHWKTVEDYIKHHEDKNKLERQPSHRKVRAMMNRNKKDTSQSSNDTDPNSE